MPRLLAHILSCAALLMQVGMGALPRGQFCVDCGPRTAPANADACCCASERAAPAACCCPVHPLGERGDCHGCLHVQSPEREVTCVSRIVFEPRTDVSLALPSESAAAILAPFAPRCAHERSPPSEAPPHLALLRSVCLLV